MDSIEKRMVADTGYEVIHAIRIGDSEILIAEKMDSPTCEYYMKTEYSDNGIIAQYDRTFYSTDYCAVMDAYTCAIDKQLDAIRAEIVQTGHQHKIIKADECYPNDYGQDITGKVVAVKPEVMRPEYRRGDMQLVLVSGGNGARGGARGSAVFCYHLTNGQHTRFERYELLGIMRVLPAWAVERLAEIQEEIGSQRNPEKTTNGIEKVAGYTITERLLVGNKIFVMGENPNAVSPFVTWQGYEGRTGYDHGHYFSNIRRARIDLHTRAGKERENTAQYRAKKMKTRDDAR